MISLGSDVDLSFERVTSASSSSSKRQTGSELVAGQSSSLPPQFNTHLMLPPKNRGKLFQEY